MVRPRARCDRQCDGGAERIVAAGYCPEYDYRRGDDDRSGGAGIVQRRYQLCDKSTPRLRNGDRYRDGHCVDSPVADAGSAAAGTPRRRSPTSLRTTRSTVRRRCWVGLAMRRGAERDLATRYRIEYRDRRGHDDSGRGAGIYSIDYQLCDKSTPANCATMTDTVTVTGSINAGGGHGNSCGRDRSTPIANVASNDTVNGAAAMLACDWQCVGVAERQLAGGIALNTATGAVTTTAVWRRDRTASLISCATRTRRRTAPR